MNIENQIWTLIHIFYLDWMWSIFFQTFIWLKPLVSAKYQHTLGVLLRLQKEAYILYFFITYDIIFIFRNYRNVRFKLKRIDNWRTVLMDPKSIESVLRSNYIDCIEIFHSDITFCKIISWKIVQKYELILFDWLMNTKIA